MDTKEITYFYNKHYKRLYNISLRITGDTGDAEEIMQDTILKYLDMTDPPLVSEQQSAWLARTCINASIDRIRRKKREAEFIEEYKNEESEVYEPEVDCSSLNVDIVRKAISSLFDPYRLILMLRLIEGYDYEEIASITNTKESTIRSHYLRGKNKLMNILKQSIYDKEN